MKTQTIIEYNAVDVTAKSDSEYSSSDIQNFANINNLKKNKMIETKYATLEKNFTVLDGKSKFIDNDVNVAYWSNSMSDENGEFENAPSLTINFVNEVHSSIGLTLTFSQYSYPTELTITYYNSQNSELSSRTFYPDNYEYFCEQIVANYKKIVIEFKKTMHPYRYIKLNSIVYGKLVEFTGEMLVSANLVESVDMLSDEISINTLDFTLYSNDDSFNILNPQGMFKTLQERQIINAYKVQNNEEKEMGTFYLDSWKSENDNKMKFSAIDLIGILDKSEFLGGIYTNITLENIIEEIMTSANIESTSYEIENSIKNIELSGYIPICTHREALQFVLFTVGALANCSRSDKINIYTIDSETEPIVITKENTLKGTRKIEQGQIVTGVSVIAHKYRTGSISQVLFEGVVESGTHLITFDEPAHGVTCSGGTITESGANYVKVTTSSTTNITLTGYQYIHDMQTFTVNDEQLSENEKTNILKIDTVFLINNNNATDIANRVLQFYKKSYKSKFEYIHDDEAPSDSVIVSESFGNYLVGYITQLDIDMTKGYITKAEIIAKVSEET